MPQVTGLSSLVQKLKDKVTASVKGDNTSVIVGFSTGYAVFVHENLEALHGAAYNAAYADQIASGAMHDRGPRQQAKYLEQPARELNNNGELRRILTEGYKRGLNLEQCLMLCGLRIQRESQNLVPVDTGLLRSSAFTKVSKETK